MLGLATLSVDSTVNGSTTRGMRGGEDEEVNSRQKVAAWILAFAFLLATGTAVFEAVSVASTRRDAENDARTREAVWKVGRERLEADLDEATEKLEDAKDRIGDLQSNAKELRGELKNTNADLRAATVFGAEQIAVVEAKADCLDVVLDAYNQNWYYDDIGIALERALDSAACVRAGIY